MATAWQRGGGGGARPSGWEVGVRRGPSPLQPPRSASRGGTPFSPGGAGGVRLKLCCWPAHPPLALGLRAALLSLGVVGGGPAGPPSPVVRRWLAPGRCCN